MASNKVTRQQLRALRGQRDEGPADQYNEAHGKYADAFDKARLGTAAVHIAEEIGATVRGQRG